MSARTTPQVSRSADGSVTIGRGTTKRTLSREDALRLWVLLSAATMPAEDCPSLPTEAEVDTVLAELANESSPTTHAADLVRGDRAVAELERMRDAVAFAGASCDREVCLFGVHLRPSRKGPPSDVVMEHSDAAEHIARAFHTAYERLAPRFGYRTRAASAVPWEEVAENLRGLMAAVVLDLLGDGTIAPPRAPAERTTP